MPDVYEGIMLTNPDIAKQISELMLDISGRLDESVAIVNKSCSSAEDSVYRRAVGRILAKILIEILNPLYKEHPALKPPGME